jgi:hypothetical protein
MGTSGFRSLRPSLLCVIEWFDMFGFWLLVTRDYHMTLAVATLAAALLIASSASAVYIDGCFLRPGSQGFGCGGGNLLFLLATATVLTGYGGVLIQVVYDVLRGRIRRGSASGLSFSTTVSSPRCI